MKMSREQCVLALRECAAALDRYPKKSDFSEDEVAMIKAYFGPWPRALEAAGVKERTKPLRAERRKEKRIEKKRARNTERKNIKKQNLAEKKGMEEE